MSVPSPLCIPIKSGAVSVDEKNSFLNVIKQMKAASEHEEVGVPWAVKQTSEDTLSRKSAKKVVIFYVFVMPYILATSSDY